MGIIEAYKTRTTTNKNNILDVYKKRQSPDYILNTGAFEDRLSGYERLIKSSLNTYKQYDSNKYYTPDTFKPTQERAKLLHDYAKKYLDELEKNKSNYDTTAYNNMQTFLKNAGDITAQLSEGASNYQKYYSQFKDEGEHESYQHFNAVAKSQGYDSINDMAKRINELKTNISTYIKDIQSSGLPAEVKLSQMNSPDIVNAKAELDKLMNAYTVASRNEKISAAPDDLEPVSQEEVVKSWAEWSKKQAYNRSAEKLLKDAHIELDKRKARDIDRIAVNRQLESAEQAAAQGNEKAKGDIPKLKDDIYNSLAYTIRNIHKDSGFSWKASQGLQKLVSDKRQMTEEQKKIYDNLTDDELKVVGYLYETEGYASVEQYYRLMQEAVNYRKGEKRAEGVDSWWEKALLSIEAGGDQFVTGIGGLADLVTGKTDIGATKPVQYARQTVREKMAEQGDNTILFDLGTTITNMIPSVIAGTVVAGISGQPLAGTLTTSAIIGGSASGNAYQQAIREGFSVQQAQNYGMLVGVSETSIQAILGGAGRASGIAVNKAVKAINSKLGEKALSSISKVLANTSVKFGTRALGEFTEEYIQEILEPVYRNICFDENNEFVPFSEEALYAGILGALSSVVFSGGDAVISKVGKTNIADTIGEAKRNIPNEKAALKFEQIIADVALKNNITEADAKLILADSQQSKYFSIATGINITANTKPSDIVSAVKSTNLIPSTQAQTAHTAQTRTSLVDGATDSKKPIQSVSVAVSDNAQYKGKPINIRNIDSVKSGVAYVKTDSGVISAKDIDFDNATIKNLYEKAGEYNTRAAKTFISAYNGAQDIESYSKMFNNFYTLGKLGVEYSEAEQANGYYAKTFGVKSTRLAYYAGVNAVRAEQSRTISIDKPPAIKAEGKFIDTAKSVSDLAKSLYTAVAQKTGLDVEIVKELPNDANGAYSKKLAKIILSESAINKPDVLIHEMFEFATVYDKEGFNTVKDTVLEWYAQRDSKTLDKTVEAYQKTYKAVDKTTTYRQASAEMTRDALSAVFASEQGVTDFVNWLVDSTNNVAEQRTIIEKIKDFINTIIAALKDFINGKNINKQAQKLLEADVDFLTKLRNDVIGLWNSAIEKYQSDKGEVLFVTDDDSYSLESADQDDVSFSRQIPDDMISETKAPSIFEIAKQPAQGVNAEKVYEARRQINTFSLKENAADVLGITQRELNKQLQLWKYYKSGTEQQDVIKSMKILQRNKMYREGSRKEHREYRDGIKKIINDFNKRMFHPTESVYAPQNLMKAVVNVARLINLDTGQKAPDGSPTKVKLRLMELQKQYDVLAKDATYEYVYDKGISERIEKLANVLDGKAIKDLTLSEIKVAYDTLKLVQTAVKNQVKLIDMNTRLASYEYAENVIQEIRQSKGASSTPIGKFENAFITASLNAGRQFRRMVGYKPDSAWVKLGQELDKGQLREMNILMEGTKHFADVFEGDNNKKQLRKIQGKHAELIDTGLKFDDGSPVIITPAMRIALYLHNQNESNRKHIANGGVVIPVIKDYARGKKQSAFDRGLRIKLQSYEVAKILEGMTDYEKLFAKLTDSFFNDFSKKVINETSLKLNGYKKANVINYFPINTDKNFLKTDFESIVRDGSIENWGALKERRNASNPIYLEDVNDTISRTLKMLAKYGGLSIPVRNFNKVYKVSLVKYTDSVQKAVAQTWDTKGKKYIENLIADLSGNRWGDSNVFDFAKGMFAQSVLAANLSVTLKQAASYPTAAYILGAKPLAQALIKKGLSRADRAIIDKYTPLLWYRNQGNSTQELGDVSKRVDLSKKLPMIMNWIQKTDTATVGRLWYASEYYIMSAKPELEVKSDKFYRAVGEVFNEVVLKTQPNYTIMERPDILRNPNPLVRGLTMFMTQRMQNFGILYDSVNNWRAQAKEYRKNPTDENKSKAQRARTEFAKAASSQIVAAMTIAMINVAYNFILAGMSNYKDEEKDIVTAEAFVEKFGADIIESLSGSAIGGAELFNLIHGALNDRKPFDIDVPAVTAINDLYQAMYNLINAATHDPKNAEKEIADFAKQAAAVFKGIPAKNIEKLLKGIYNRTLEATGKAPPSIKWARDENRPIEERFEIAKEALDITAVTASGTYDSAVTKEFCDLYFYAMQNGREDVANTIKNWLLENGRTELDISKRYNERLRETSPYSVDDIIELLEGKKNTENAIIQMKEYGYSNTIIKNALKNYYQPIYQKMYLDNKTEGMRDIRYKLFNLRIGYKPNDFVDWIKNIKREAE